MELSRWRAWCAVLWLALSLPAMAQDLGMQSAHLKVNRIESATRFAADASSVSDYTLEREALSDQGARMVGKATRSYHRALQRHEVVEAYTLKADGRKLAVAAEAIQVQSGVASSGTAPSMPEVAIVVITFPDVQRGDRTVLRGRLTSHTPMLPGWAQVADFIVPVVAIELAAFRLEAPKALGLKVFSEGFALQRDDSADTEVWQLRANAAARVLDPAGANMLTSMPRLYASVWSDHTQLARAYAEQFNAKAVVTDEVRRLALEITRDKPSSRAKAAAIHDWMRHNIRYVAVYLGVGGFVPHDVGWILGNRYGDCKDQALLMQALLKAVDIEAVPVLINSMAEYVLPELPTLASFNHCILYLPGLDLFADPTDGRVPFGALPMADSDKPVAVALAGGAKLMRTPSLSPDANRVSVRSVWRISKNGHASAEIRVESTGYTATMLQDRLAQIPADMGGEAVQKLLTASDMKGTGVVRFPAIQRDVQRQTMELDIDVPALLSEPQGGSLRVNPALALPVFALGLLGNYEADKRQVAMPCPPVRVREEFELHFAPEFKLFKAPDNVKLSLPDGVAYEAQYRLEAQVLTGWRELVQSQRRHWCSPADYSARRSVMNDIRRNLRASVLYQQ
jgi:transglutaminase-like putative cysteine protease